MVAAIDGRPIVVHFLCKWPANGWILFPKPVVFPAQTSAGQFKHQQPLKKKQ